MTVFQEVFHFSVKEARAQSAHSLEEWRPDEGQHGSYFP